MQTMYAMFGDVLRSLSLPAPDDHVLPGIPWGRFDELLTPAYWCGQVWQHERLGTYDHFRLGRTLTEETAACLLGGFGMKAELGLAAFARLRDLGLLTGAPTAADLENALSKPFVVAGRHRMYRFPRQKARYLAVCMRELSGIAEPADDIALRDLLETLPGIGPKTASWIVRNYRASNAVAIIDIHILRAGRHIGIFDSGHDPQRSYHELEERFLCFASLIGVRPVVLDGLMWDQMRRLSSTISDLLPGRWLAKNASAQLDLKLA